MGETEIDVAIKMFEENFRMIDAQKNPYQYNQTCGLLALARAIKEIQKEIKQPKD